MGLKFRNRFKLSCKFAALTSRKLLGLKVTTIWTLIYIIATLLMTDTGRFCPQEITDILLMSPYLKVWSPYSLLVPYVLYRKPESHIQTGHETLGKTHMCDVHRQNNRRELHRLHLPAVWVSAMLGRLPSQNVISRVTISMSFFKVM